MHQSQWPTGEWEHVCQELESLSTHDLSILAADLDIEYASETGDPYNDHDYSERDTIIGALEQADPEELVPTLENLLRRSELPLDTIEE